MSEPQTQPQPAAVDPSDPPSTPPRDATDVDGPLKTPQASQGPKLRPPTPEQPEPADAPEAVIEQPTSEPAPTPAPSGIWGVVPLLVIAAMLSLVVHRLGSKRLLGEIKRWAPMAHLVIWCVALWMIARASIRSLSTDWLIFELVLLLVLIVLNHSWLRSVFSGVALALEGRLRLGDTVRVGAMEGELMAFGVRAVRVRAVDGTTHEIPHEQLVAHVVAKVQAEGGESACDITMMIPLAISPERALALARAEAMLSPLASPRHRPEAFLHAPEDASASMQLVIRGYAFDPAYQEHFRSDVVGRVTRAFAGHASQAAAPQAPPL